MYAADVTITPSGTIASDGSGGYNFNGDEITVSGDEIGNALNGIDIATAKVNSLTLGDLSKAVTDNQAAIKTADDRITTVNENIRKDFADGDAALDQKISQANGDIARLDATKASQSDVDSLLYKTKGISYTQTTGVNGFTTIAGELKINGNNGEQASLTLIDNDTSANSITITAKKLVTWNNAINEDGTLSGKDGSRIGGVTFNDGKMSGVEGINDDIIKFTKNGTKDIVQINSELMLNDNAGKRSATLNIDSIKNLNHLINDSLSKPDETNGKTVITAGDGSIVGGLTFNDGTIDNVTSIKSNLSGNDIFFDQDTGSNKRTTIEGTVKISAQANTPDGTYGNVAINEGYKHQVVIGKEGLVVGQNSSVVNDDGVFTGGHDYDNAKAAMRNSDGAIKGANGKFAVDGATGAVTATGGYAIDTNNSWTSNNLKVGDGTNSVTLAGGNVTATGKLQGKKVAAGTNGDEFTVDENGNIVSKGTLEVAGKTTLKDALDVKGKATFGNAPGALTEIDGDKFKTGVVTTDSTQESNIGGVTMVNGKITADNMTINGTLDLDNLQVNESLSVGTFNVTKAGAMTGVTAINGASITASGTGLQIGSATVGDANPFSSTGFTVDATGNVTAGTYNGNTIGTDKKFNGVELNGGNVEATKVTADTLTDGNGFTATGGNVSAKDIDATTGTIGGVSFNGGNVNGINNLTATGTIQAGTLKVNDNNLLDSNGLKSEKAVIDSIVIDDASITTTGANGLDIEKVNLKNGAITANSATIGGVNKLDNTGITVDTGKKIQVGANTIIEDGELAVSTNTKLTDQELTLNTTNTWTQTGGLVADKATVNGVVLGADGTKGKATFTDDNGATIITGKNIETGTIKAEELLVDSISLGKDPANKNITIRSNGDIETKGKITVKDDTGATVSEIAQDKATFGKDDANKTTITNGKINAKVKNNADQQAEFNFDENGLTVSGQTAEGKTSSFEFDTQKGAGTFTGLDKTTTNINGSKLTSTNGSATGVLDGSNLTLTDGSNSTKLTAGGVKFVGAKGESEKQGNTTTIDGGTITTDTLNVERINLGEEMHDAAGTTHGANLSMDKEGNFMAAGGNFTVIGGSGANKGAFTNKVGNTTLKTDENGAGMSYDKTASGGVKSEVSVGDGAANVSAGAGSIGVKNDEIKSAVGSDASSTITSDKIVDKVGNNSVTTDASGTTFDNGSGKTTINGDTITTGKLITDSLVIKGNQSGDTSAVGGETGSIAFGGDGTITSNIKDGDKETTFETKAEGVRSEVTEGTSTSKNTQTATSIGSVITNGTVKIAQTLDGENGNITNEVTDKDNNSSKLVQDGKQLEFTDSANADTATRITGGDVSIGSATDDSKRINLSDLGQIDDIDGELQGRDEYKNNSTAVGGLNAEAAIRREEVARLDNRIDDVNNRVDKVGAMAAAIASLKTMGYDPQAPSEFSVGLGQYKGETGVALGFFHYPNKNFMVNVSLSTAGGETMGGIGATWRFGHKSPQKLLQEQREAQAKKELAAAEKYRAAAQLAKEAQERAEYAAKLARQAQVSADNAKAAADATQAKHFNK